MYNEQFLNHCETDTDLMVLKIILRLNPYTVSAKAVSGFLIFLLQGFYLLPTLV